MGNACVGENQTTYQNINIENVTILGRDKKTDDLSSNQKDRTFKILLLGDSGVGKSSILHKLCNEEFQMSHISTIGVDYKTLTILIQDRYIKLNIWDTAGQERYKSITQSYFRDVHGVAFVFDITNKQSFQNIAKWMNDMKKQNPNFISILIGNKIDLDDLRCIKKEEANEFASKNSSEYIETSAKNSNNIDDIFKKFAIKLISEN
eukprot:gene1450-12069_t